MIEWNALKYFGNLHYVKVSVIRVFLVHFQFKCGKIRTRKTLNTDTFHALAELNIHLAEQTNLHPAGIYLLKVNNRNTGKRCKICSKLTIKTRERRHWRRSGIFIVNFEHISHLVLLFLLLSLNM